MKAISPLVIRDIHRWSGLLLLPFLLTKILSGYNATGRVSIFAPEIAYRIHSGIWADLGVLFLLCVHAAYAFLRLFLPKMKNKGNALFIASGTALVIFLVTVFFLYR